MSFGPRLRTPYSELRLRTPSFPPCPNLSDFKAEMNGSKYFSKIDLKQAYHQLELTEECRYINYYIFYPRGFFCYIRLIYVTNNATEIFQNIPQRNLSDIQGVKNIPDDIIIHGKTRKLHDEALENCLQRPAHPNLKAKPVNVVFYKRKFTSLV